MMRSKIYKLKTIALVLGVSAAAALPAGSYAAGIPVYCLNCQQGSHDAAHAVLDGLRMQTQQLLNAIDYSVKAQETIATQREVAIAKAQESIQLSKDVGTLSKPRHACSHYEAAGIRGAVSGGGGKAATEVITRKIEDHNTTGQQLAEGEPQKEYHTNKVLKEYLKEEDAVKGSSIVLMEPFEIDENDKGKKENELLLLTNPNPVSMPSEKGQLQILQKGSPSEKHELSKRLTVNERMAAAQAILIEHLQKYKQNINPTAIKTLLESTLPYLSESEKAEFSKKISPEQLERLFATYRVTSPMWILETMTSSSDMKMQRELVLIGAEQLRQQYTLNKNIEQLTRLMASMETRMVSAEMKRIDSGMP